MEELKPLLIWEHGCSPKSNLSPFFPQECDCSLRQLKPLLPWKNGSFQKNCSWATNVKNLPKGNLF